MARPNAVAENNAIANTPASAVTVIGARARRSSVIPLPNTANARQQQQHPPHRPGHPATGGQHVQTHSPPLPGTAPVTPAATPASCGPVPVTADTVSVSGSPPSRPALVAVLLTPSPLPPRQRFPRRQRCQQYCGHTSFWHLLRFSDSRQIPMRCQFALRKLSVVSAHKRCLRSLSANANKGCH